MNTETQEIAKWMPSIILDREVLTVLKYLYKHVKEQDKQGRTQLTRVEYKQLDSARALLTYTQGTFLIEVNIAAQDCCLPELCYLCPKICGSDNLEQIVLKTTAYDTDLAFYDGCGWQIVVDRDENYPDYTKIKTDKTAELPCGVIGLNPDLLTIFTGLNQKLDSSKDKCLKLSFHGELGVIDCATKRVSGIIMPMKL